MSQKIYGVTVGTPLSPSGIKEKLNPVTSVNGTVPDEHGNVNVDVPEKEPLVVNLLDDGTTDRSANEIVTAIESGKPVAAFWNNINVAPVVYGENQVLFCAPLGELMVAIVIADSTYAIEFREIPSKSDIPTKPEDIGAQPVGDYLTEVPGGYATEQFVRDGYQPKGNYLTEHQSLDGYATEEFVKNKIAEAELGGEEVDLSGYAQKSELPTKVSQLENDKNYLTEHQDISGKLDASALPTAINTALAQAKASGEFDGKDGSDGKDGYTPVKGVDYFDGQPGKDGVDGKDGADGYTPVKGKDYFDGEPGQPGQDGSPGKDGAPATHSWNGTVLTITSASGTSSADLKGEKGDKGDKGDSIKGDKGDTGATGSPGTSVTVKSVSESTEDGGSNVVTFSDGKTITIKNGSKGSTGAAGKDGSDATVTADSIENALGYTPADKNRLPIIPQDYGAKGDGSTDDTAAFKNALASNRIVFVPGGSYKLSSELIIGNNCQLELAQDAVLYFTQTTGNCISLKMCSWVKGNHATVSVPYGFTGNVVNIDTGYTDDLYDTPPFGHWDPVWKPGRYVTDLNIVKPNSYKLNYSDNGECSGTGVFINTDGNDLSTFLWGVDLSGLRIAGAFTYGVYGITSNVNGDSGWNHDMKLGGLISGCETGVKLTRVHKVYLSTLIQPQKSRTGVAYAKNGIVLDNCRYMNLLNARTFDWNSNFTKWEEGNENQHIALLGDCSGLVLEDWNYYAFGSNYDIRSLIYTDTPSNLERMVILQEPFTRWFKPKDGLPYFNDGDFEKRLLLKEEFDTCFMVDSVPNFKNVLPTAIDKDGKIFNGIGYMPSGMRMVLASGEYAETDYYGCTGLIPIKQGDTIYTKALSFKGDDGYEGAVIFDSSFKRITSCSSSTVHNMSSYFEYSTTGEGFMFKVKSPATVAYIAFSFMRGLIGENPAVSINEPLTYSQRGFLADTVEVKSENVYGLDSAVETALAQAKASGQFDGAKGDKGDKGDTGATGADGKTPVRGTDYWTSADKTEIINSVLSSLPVYSGEVI